ncbi:hypothetical protein HY771_01490, partial [Candidatus Uhrbacteria bacterium]|nr:hypothetical protein [Candidatus Uhrbacteria bacterium]
MNLTHQHKLFSLLTIASMLAMVIWLTAFPALAVSPPNIVAYQGRVLDANGVPVSSSSLSMKFFFYTALTGGTCVWSNSSGTCDSNTPGSTTARTVTLTNGLFTENLGDTAASTPYSAIADSTFADNAGIYLEVIIAGETLTPRKQLVAAPYALNADTLDGIDLSVIQLWEVGSGGSYEDDAAVIVGTNAAFSYGTGGTGDLRVADEIEVLGDGFIDNDLVVGASTSATETIANVAFSLGGNDLFAASDVGIEGNLYIDGAIDLVGTATVGDLSCTDCLDFTELLDSLSLDASTSIAMDGAETFTITNDSTGATILDLRSTGDLEIHDVSTAFFTFNDDRSIDYSSNQSTTDPFDFTVDSVTSANALDFSVDALTTGRGMYLTTTSGAATSADLFVAAASGQYTTTGQTVSGNLADISRSLDLNDSTAGVITLTVNSPVVTITDNCTSTGNDTCTHTGNVLSLTQSYATSSGNALVISNAGTGDSINIAGAGTGTAIDIDSTTYGTDIELQNDETISNDTDGQIIFGVTGANELSLSATALFPSTDSGLDLGTSSAQFADLYLDGGNINLDNASDFDIDDNTASALTVTEGSTSYLAITTTNSAETITIGSTSLTQLSLTTDNNAATDILMTGSATITNDFQVSDDASFGGDVNIALDDGDTIDLTTDGSATTTVLSVVQTSATADADAMNIVLTQSNGTTTAADNVGLDMTLVGNDADADVFGIRITATPTSAAAANTYEAGLSIVNAENTAGSMPDAIIITSSGVDTGITDGIDVSDSNITNAVNAGINFYNMDGIRFFEGSTGTLTFEDTSGNDLMTLTDSSNAGNVSLTGAITTQAGAAFTDYASIASSGAVIGQQTNNTTLTANRNDFGGYFSVSSGADPGASMHELYGSEGVATYTRSSGSAANAIYGVSGVAIHSSSALTVTTASGITGRSQSSTGGGTITNAIGVDGLIVAGAGAVTNGFGGRFSNTADGTSRFGVFAEASGGTNNFAAYFSGAQVHVATDSSPATPTLATGAGDLYVESDLEIDSDLQIDGGDLVSTAASFNIFDAASNPTTIDIGGVTTDLANTISIATQATSADVIAIGNTHTSTTLSLVGGNDWNMSAAGVLTIAPAGTGTFVDFALETEWTSGDLINADFAGATSGTGSMIGLDLDFTNFTPSGAQDTYGVHVNDADTNPSANQYGVFIQGSNWDYGLLSEDLVQVGLGDSASTTAVCSSLANATSPTAGIPYELRDCSGGPAADYAEQYPVAEGISYGDIVVPGSQNVVTQDGNTIVQLVKSSVPYQGPVSGIVSDNYGDFTSAGYNVNESDNPMPVALVGRVPVNVTSENGALRVGDYLTTS